MAKGGRRQAAGGRRQATGDRRQAEASLGHASSLAYLGPAVYARSESRGFRLEAQGGRSSQDQGGPAVCDQLSSTLAHGAV
eukprot:CAMPEP_0182536418 /NCGR_PEP_ID=MMETSP1323-20130603/19962_1 /TAXON_ID=236787 /ORGANISM="Florenciella parvula, Strain RCC1693" /LENGTH=80 /DNA_ID=CAMNT_0024746649 /DNA_START=46 /DNA_END=284 /DNA_ORIENTATION=-